MKLLIRMPSMKSYSRFTYQSIKTVPNLPDIEYMIECGLILYCLSMGGDPAFPVEYIIKTGC